MGLASATAPAMKRGKKKSAVLEGEKGKSPAGLSTVKCSATGLQRENEGPLVFRRAGKGKKKMSGERKGEKKYLPAKVV